VVFFSFPASFCYISRMVSALGVENVSKQYRIYDQPADRLKESLTRGRLRRHREFWALRDINFEIEAGTTVGIIGQNGCGKSTLLQIISGTLTPTQGNVWSQGRIAALLELGAGFNPEFTGVENVFMNASLMGFSRRETQKLLPSIERFAEIGQFIYQPVKTYSSGMYVRLAFAIAASVEPAILVIDEALAVGDAVFQHRCLRRIKELHDRGCTVLFVSHDTAAVRALCDRAILLNVGRMIADGNPADVLNDYQRIVMERQEAFDVETAKAADSASAESKPQSAVQYTYRHGDGSATIVETELCDSAGRRVQIVETGAPLTTTVSVRFERDVESPVIGFLIRNRLGIHAYGTNTKEQEIQLRTIRSGEVVSIRFAFRCWLGIDDYSISFAVHSLEGQAYDWVDGAWFFRVVSAKVTEGVANLNATATVLKSHGEESRMKTESVSYG
jgi:lipopolysaccharide transport system ATP-binding protein